jgi:hypothetical protein
MAASKAGQYRGAASVNLFQCSANAHVAACGNESPSEGCHRFAITSCLVIYLGEVQIELGMVPLYFESFSTQLLTSKITLLGHSREHAYIGKIEWILWLSLESPANVRECDALVLIIKMSEALCEFCEPYTSRRLRFHLV